MGYFFIKFAFGCVPKQVPEEVEEQLKLARVATDQIGWHRTYTKNDGYFWWFGVGYHEHHGGPSTPIPLLPPKSLCVKVCEQREALLTELREILPEPECFVIAGDN